MKILLLSAYHAESHKAWCDDLIKHGGHEFTLLSLPARYFSWRIRGNPLSWANENIAELKQNFDLIVATSMADVATLRGLVPKLAVTPCIVYFHENQFAYPATTQQHKSLEPQMVNLYAACSAQKVVFNSHYNQLSFYTGVAQLLAKLPDHVPNYLIEQLQQKSLVLPVPISPIGCANPKPTDVLNIVWNHRWEYDKGPERLLALLQQLPKNLPVMFHIVGQQFRQSPPEFAMIKTLLSEKNWLGQWGYIEDRQQYQRLLQQCHVVLSTAVHDFQGLAILEAVSAGCIPLLPKRLAYSDWFAECYQYSANLDSIADDAASAAASLTRLIDQFKRKQLPVAPNIEALYWANLLPQYQQLFEQVSQQRLLF